MKKIIYIVLIATGILSLGACSDFLDKTTSAYDSNGFYENEDGFNAGVTGIYAAVPYNQNWDVPAAAMQDVYSPYGLQDQENTTISAGGGLTADQTYVNSYWAGHWKIVARANSVLDGARTDLENASELYNRRFAEAKVLRAYAYYNLVMTFGDIPFFTTSVTPDRYNEPRTDKKVITDYLVNELQAIADSDILPWTSEQRGRVSRGAVYCLISRFCLLAGSLDFGGEGQQYFAKAAAAAKKVMDNVQLAQNFGDLFTKPGQAKTDVQKEILYSFVYTKGAVRHTHKTRYGHTSRTAGGSSVRFPSNYLAMCFECKDGLRVDESPIFDPKHPSWNRDPRFRHTILMHGDTMDCTDVEKKFVLNCYDKNSWQFPNPRRKGQWYQGNNADVQNSASSFAARGVGYLYNKYNTDFSEDISECTIEIIVMRAAEAYLSYAEAKIEMNQLDQTVYDAINAVRRRAGMPDFDAVKPERKGNQDLMRQIVRRERKVELAMEGLALCDFRRWGLGDILNAGPIYGQPIASIRYEGLTKADMPTFKTTTRHDINDIPDYSAVADKYTARDLRRFWAPRFQWWPIPRVDLDRNPSLSNPEGY